MGDTYSVAEAIRQARHDPGGKSLREVAERAGVSAGTINRIEKGKVARPSAQTLIAIARGLELNPFLLLVISGYVPEEEARRRLLQMFDEGSEIQQEWEREAPKIREQLGDSTWPAEEIRRLAFDLFVGEPLWEVAWDDSYLLMASGSENEQMREISTLLGAIIEERLPRVIEYLRDQAVLSRRDVISGYDADLADAVRIETARAAEGSDASS
jgi:transcriptional regulator with XRE-family HTH domain